MIEAEREPDGRGAISCPVAQEALQRSDIQGVPVIVLDEAAKYVADRTLAGEAPLSVMEGFFGVIRPPFDRCFVEFSGQDWGLPASCSVGWLA